MLQSKWITRSLRGVIFIWFTSPLWASDLKQSAAIRLGKQLAELELITEKPAEAIPAWTPFTFNQIQRKKTSWETVQLPFSGVSSALGDANTPITFRTSYSTGAIDHFFKLIDKAPLPVLFARTYTDQYDFGTLQQSPLSSANTIRILPFQLVYSDTWDQASGRYLSDTREFGIKVGQFGISWEDQTASLGDNRYLSSRRTIDVGIFSWEDQTMNPGDNLYQPCRRSLDFGLAKLGFRYNGNGYELDRVSPGGLAETAVNAYSFLVIKTADILYKPYLQMMEFPIGTMKPNNIGTTLGNSQYQQPSWLNRQQLPTITPYMKINPGQTVYYVPRINWSTNQFKTYTPTVQWRQYTVPTTNWRWK